MSNRSFEASEQPVRRNTGVTSDYSAHIQEAMRHNKLSPSDYHLVMTILRTVSNGSTEEMWKEEQKRAVKEMSEQSPDKHLAYDDTANRFEQTVNRLKELQLWPWP